MRTHVKVSLTRLYLAFVLLAGLLPLSGCVIAGVSSGGGFFIWPGSIGLIVLVLIVLFVLRRR